MTERCSTRCGVKQGGVISPIILSIYMSDILRDIKEKNLGIRIRKKCIFTLLNTDNIVIMIEKEESFKTAADTITSFGRKWRSEFNNKESQVTIHRGVDYKNKEHEQCIVSLGGDVPHFL